MTSQLKIKKALKALPAYFGGKRKIVEKIFSDQIPDKGILVDPMAGAMTIPLAAKIKGYNVIANDRSMGSYIIGKALLENNKFKIDETIIPDLLQQTKSDEFVTSTFGDIHLPIQLAKYADNIHGNIMHMNKNEQWVYLLLLYRFLTFMAPYNLYRYPGLTRGFLNKTYPDSMQGHIDKWNTNIKNPLPALQKMAAQINNAIHEGTGKIYQDDVFSFMKKQSGDILYFDPPYAGAGVPYERGYEVIEQMMERRLFTRENSIFNNTAKERDMLKAILQHANNFQWTIFSYWTELHDRSWFRELFDELNLNFEEINLGNYSYTYSTKVGKKGDWSPQKDKGTKEILFLLKAK